MIFTVRQNWALPKRTIWSRNIVKCNWGNLFGFHSNSDSFFKQGFHGKGSLVFYFALTPPDHSISESLRVRFTVTPLVPLTSSAHSDRYMAYFHRGEARESLGDFNGAIEDYNISISINPKAALPYLRRGKLKVSINDINGACLDFYSATELGAPEAYDLVKKYCQM